MLTRVAVLFGRHGAGELGVGSDQGNETPRRWRFGARAPGRILPWYFATIPRHARTIPIGRILLIGVTLVLWALPGFAGRGPGGEQLMRFGLFAPWELRTSSADGSLDDGAMDIWRAVEVHRGSFVLTCAVQGVVVVGWLVGRRGVGHCDAEAGIR